MSIHIHKDVLTFLLTNIKDQYNIKFTHKHTKKRTGFTHILNTCTYKVRVGKGSWSSYTMISEHNYHSKISFKGGVINGSSSRTCKAS